ncbi:MAG: DUF5682 family protein [Aestuariibaculum sp.]
MAVHILGIRHHGVGSATYVRQRLQQLKPDMVLVEGAPEITEVISVIGHKELVPPAAIMLYNENNAKQSTFYPFAEYSPEWVAIAYANQTKTPVRAIDLPARISFAISKAENGNKKDTDSQDKALEEANILEYHRDPLDYLAQIAGFESGEAWWDYQFETHRNNTSTEEQFEAVTLAMQSLREQNIPTSLDKENVWREAYMRYLIRHAQNEMYSNIVVVCGAWHAPALMDLKAHEKEDNKILKSLPKSKVKVALSWIPWTNSRLSRFSGYGAGITNPGWYEHLWQNSENSELQWLTRAAEKFRNEHIDVSTAHVLETYKLSFSLAQLRNHSVVTYKDLDDAIKTVMCDGEHVLYQLIHKQLTVNEKIGSIPSDLPKVPLQQDFDNTVKTLRLKLSAMPKVMDLDLRKPLDLKRSIFFHQLEILSITWITKQVVRTKGTFKESWELIWNPEMQIQLIDKAHYGNSVEMAAEAYIREMVHSEKQISVLIGLIENIIPAELFNTMGGLLNKISDESSISSDIQDVMLGLPKLIHISRYGDVRNTDLQQIDYLCHRLFYKIAVSLANACYGLDEEHSNSMFGLIGQLDKSLKLLQDDTIKVTWQKTLENIMEKDGVHMVIKGCTIRLLFDQNIFSEEALSKLLTFYLSPNQNAFDVAYWLEGFLRGSGLILIYDNKIWNLIYNWVTHIEQKQFLELIPVLRRAFSKFPFAERRRIGEKAKQGIINIDIEKIEDTETYFDAETALEVLPFIEKYLI